ncbi:MAG: succinyl-CoA synthetase subunit alpha [Geminicoccaceae bacterium]|nr:succinyl-CoA synthetase subunit alpha [Geminicoccaceae bacterium]
MIVGGNETVLVQGMTGRQGTFWTGRMREYGTGIIGGVNPKKAGTRHIGLPVWGSAVEAAGDVAIDATVLFIPPQGVKAAALDALAAGIRKLVILTEHVPVHDVMWVLAAAREAGAQVIGPNTAGIVTAGESFVGFMPASNPRIFRSGTVGVISRSGSLGTFVCLRLCQAGLGISHFIGIGGDPVTGTTTLDAVRILDADEHTEAIAIVGEIGGSMEEAAAEYVSTMTKPVAAFIAGAAAPEGRRMGHAGAIVVGGKGSFASKRRALERAGVRVVPTPAGIPDALQL